MSTGRTLPQDAPPFRLSPRGRTIALSHDPDCVVALKALGEDTRVRIMGLLIDAPLDVTEIARRVGVSQYNVSKHLRILREAGLLQVKKSGRRHLYAPPDAIRSRATESSVLDLGCCSFKFDQSSSETARPAPTRRRRRPGHDDTKSMATKATKIPK